jgi:hypothetical protein
VAEKPDDPAVEKLVTAKPPKTAADARPNKADIERPCKPQAQSKPKKTRATRKRPAKKSTVRKKRAAAKKTKGTNAA